ncbi:unnamed protein product [Sphenostylis stenocarpa]|uniref:Uncharacterized protein n=1 Tax=Sphenostylis stenocarpa TaxID=92480 RepID=A0AA86SLL8_9FABA|nr:unnamed protein product [Sphenostylis stenocarpa]
MSDLDNLFQIIRIDGQSLPRVIYTSFFKHFGLMISPFHGRSIDDQSLPRAIYTSFFK